MIYVLIFAINLGSGTGAGSAEFDSLESCNFAGEAVEGIAPIQGKFVCVPK